MNTIILMWNPSISSVNMHDYEQSMKNCIEEYFNWSVWDWEHAQACDRFYLVRVGEGNTGIVMKGVLSSEPFEAGPCLKTLRRPCAPAAARHFYKSSPTR